MLLNLETKIAVYSFWEQDYWNKKFEFVIIGAGFTGLNCAINIKEKYPKSSVLVIDNSLRFSMASTKNAGFACFGSPSELLFDIDKVGEEVAAELMTKRRAGINMINQQFAKLCDYRSCISHEWFLDSDLYSKCADKLACLNKIAAEKGSSQYTFELSEKADLPKGVVGEIQINGEGQLDPYKLHEALLSKCRFLNVELLDGVKVTQVNDQSILTIKGLELKGDTIINCTNALSSKLFNDLEITPARAQVLITSEIEDLPYNGNYHMDEGFYYFRNVGKRLLLGGARNEDIEGETVADLGINRIIAKKLNETLKRLLPDVAYEIEKSWSGIMGFTQKKTPKCEFANGVYHIVGLSGMGVALSFSLAQDLVCKLN